MLDGLTLIRSIFHPVRSPAIRMGGWRTWTWRLGGCHAVGHNSLVLLRISSFHAFISFLCSMFFFGFTLGSCVYSVTPISMKGGNKYVSEEWARPSN